MNTFRNWLKTLAATPLLGAAVFAGLASAQAVREETRDEVKGTREEVRDTKRDTRDEVRDTRQETRDDVRDKRDDARNTVKDPRDPKDTTRDQSRDARDPQTVRDARENLREDRREVRDERADTRAAFRAEGTRTADFGLWFNRAAKEGLEIADIASRGAISKIGFREGDRVVSVNGQKVTRENDFVNYLFDNQARTGKVKVIVVRDGSEETVLVEPALFIDELSYVDNDPLETFGVIIDDRYDDKLVVLRVIPRSPAYYAGIRAGDVLTTLGNQRLTNVANLIERLTGAEPGEVQVQINRGQSARTLHVDLPRFVARTERRAALRPNFDNATERRDDRIERRDDRVEDRRDAIPAPRTPVPQVNPPAVTPTPAPAPRPATPVPAPGNNPAPRPGLFPRGK